MEKGMTLRKYIEVFTEFMSDYLDEELVGGDISKINATVGGEDDEKDAYMLRVAFVSSSPVTPDMLMRTGTVELIKEGEKIN